MNKFEKLHECGENYVLLTDNFEDFSECNKIYLDKEKYSLSRFQSNVIVFDDPENLSLKMLKKSISHARNFFKKCRSNKYRLGIDFLEKKVLVVIITNDFCSKNVMNIVTAINAALISNKEKRYSLIYDIVCDYLDNDFRDNNYCDFKDDVCVAKRNCESKRSTMGCCYHFNKMGIFGKINLCENLVDRACTIKCISCKLFTCDYIKKKYRIKDIFLLDYFFNPIQKLIIKSNCFKTKEQIMKKLLLWSII